MLLPSGVFKEHLVGNMAVDEVEHSTPFKGRILGTKLWHFPFPPCLLLNSRKSAQLCVAALDSWPHKAYFKWRKS